MQRTIRLAAIAAIAGFSALVSSSNAAVVTFDTASDFTNNFRAYTNNQTLAVAGGALTVTAASAAAHAVVYDTTPVDDSVKSTFNALTGPVTVSFSLGSVTNANASIGVYFVDASQPASQFASGIVLLNVNNSGTPAVNDQIRVASYVQPSSASAGTLTSLTSGTDLGIGLNGSPTTVTATYTRISAQNSSIAMTIGANTYTGNFTGWWSPTNVEVGLRVFPNGGSYAIDNFTVVPEPAALSLAGAIGLLVLRRNRA